MQLSIEKFI